METAELVPGLHLIRLGISNAYVWQEGGSGTTLVDSGPPGSGPAIRAALDALGIDATDMRRLVLTHFHDDHAGSAAEVATWSEGITVIVGKPDAEFARGAKIGPAPDFTVAEAQLHAVVAADLPSAPPVRVDQEVAEGDVLPFGGGATVLVVPGHTPGSIALHLPEHRLLIAGDTIAEHEGRVILGPFNTDRVQAWQSLQRLAALDVDIACFGHGEPVVGNAMAALRSATDVFA